MTVWIVISIILFIFCPALGLLLALFALLISCLSGRDRKKEMEYSSIDELELRKKKLRLEIQELERKSVQNMYRNYDSMSSYDAR